MDDELSGLDRELRDLGALWRAENPVDFEPAPLQRRGRSGPGGWWLAVAAAAAVVTAIAGTVTLLPNGGGSAPSNAPAAPQHLSCAETLEQPVAGAPAVPTDAVAARLCGRIPNETGFDSVWPGDVLTGAAAADLAERLNALDPFGGSPTTPSAGDIASCQQRAPMFTLVLRYADGRRVRVDSGVSADCELLSVDGGRAWLGASEIRAAALRAIQGQRVERGPLGSPVATLCPKRWEKLAGIFGAAPVTATTPVAVTACEYQLDDESGNLRAGGDARGELEWERIVREPEAVMSTALAGVLEDPCAGEPYVLATTQRILLVRDGYGEIHVVSAESCWPSTLTGEPRYPASALAGQLAALAPR